MTKQEALKLIQWLQYTPTTKEFYETSPEDILKEYEKETSNIFNATFESEFKIGQRVFLKTDADQLERFVTTIHLHPNSISYTLINNVTESSHYGFEISSKRDIIKVTSN